MGDEQVGETQDALTALFEGDAGDGWRFVNGRYVPPPQFLAATWTIYAPRDMQAPCTWYQPDQSTE